MVLSLFLNVRHYLAVNRSTLINKLIQSRFGGVFILYFLFVTIAGLTRLALLVHAFPSVDAGPLKLLGVFGCGLLYDVAAAAYASLPLVLYLLVLPRRWLASRAHRLVSCGLFAVTIYLLLFGAAAEWFFWEEFDSRFNFIAVDYLIYTSEVVGNIRESYPLPAILAGLAVLTGAVFFGLWKTRLLQQWFDAADGARAGRTAGLAWLALPLAFQLGLSNRLVPEFGNAYNQELARNGLYAFFAAYWDNALDYNRFYPTLPKSEAFGRLKPLLSHNAQDFTGDEPTDITRRIASARPEQHWNVIQLTVESLSARFLGCFGNSENLTPHLDGLFAESLVFTNCYATGTRTVRGMEALTLSVPPTPGQSIVRRPRNGNLFSLGALFRTRGYDTAFIYSGFGYFDNMNAFFAANGYRVIDRSSVKRDDITYATVWGACDEDLYRWTLREADAAFAAGKPFHHFVMTTSNHRPFGFPDGKIDLASGSRRGAVKYTDYAIGQFLAEAQTRPWFTNTLFVIVADHCASAAGKTTLPIPGFHIPALIWNPLLVKPQVVGNLCSQIDLPPTLLNLMNWSYDSRFFGKDVLGMQVEDQRAFLATYQRLGYLRPGRLAVLEPVRRHRVFTFETFGGEVTPGEEDAEFIRAAIAEYQTASYLFAKGLNHAPDAP